MAIKALVVDNNPVLLKEVCRLLEQEECEVRQACNGLEALEILHDYHPDIVFTDLIMPMVGGDSLCKIIRKSPDLRNIFIVILSAIILEDRERILAGIDYDIRIAKGNINELREHLREALGMYQNKSPESDRILGDDGRDTYRETGSVLQELLSEKYHLNEIFNNLSEGLVELSHQGKVVSLNQAAKRIFDRDLEELVGVDFSSLSWRDHFDKVLDWLEKDLKGKGGEVLEITESEPLKIKDRIISASFIPMQDNEHIFGICILRDITRQYLAEKQKREFDNAVRLVKKMDAMSCMAGGIAHDLNNLLTVICGNLEIIDLTDPRCDLKEYVTLLENARNAASMTVELTRKISSFSPFGIIRRENIMIEGLVSAILKEFFHDKPCGYTVNFGEKKNIVNCDSEQIAAAVTGVLQNAIEANGDGEIRVSVIEKSFDKPFLKSGQYIPEGDFVGITIEDNGKGIENENLLKIFDPYFSTKQRGAVKGMGLGLAIIYSTMRNHGGYVNVESEYGKGTKVTLYIPQCHSLTDSKDILQIDSPKKRKILFVEPDEQLRVIGEIMLEYLGLQPITAQNREHALKIVETSLAKGDPLDMAILNFAGSEDCDGVDMCKALHDIAPELKVVVSNSTLSEPVIRNYKEYGFINILPKPYTLDDLKRVTSNI